jgi:hypothetical protein
MMATTGDSSLNSSPCRSKGSKKRKLNRETSEQAGDSEPGQMLAPSFPVRKRQKKYQYCLLCGCDSDDHVFAASRVVKGKTVADGPGCMPCYVVWVQGNFGIMVSGVETFDGFCHHCAEPAGEADKVSFKEAKATSSAFDVEKPKPFLAAEVSGHSASGYTAKSCYMGLTAKSFFNKFQVTPESLGFKLQDLVNEHGKIFKGVLMIDPDQPDVRYEFFRTVSSDKHELKMPRSSMLWSGQDKLVYENMLAESAKSPMLQKLRTATLTVDQVQKVQAAAVKSSSLASQWFQADSEEVASDDGSEEVEESQTTDSLKGPAAPALSYGSLAVDDAIGSKRTGARKKWAVGSLAPEVGSGLTSAALSNLGGGGAMPSAYGSESGDGVSSMGDLATGGRGADSAVKNMQKLKISDILQGKKVGVQIRFAELYLTKCKSNDAEYFPLKEHLELVKHAVVLSESSIEDMDRNLLLPCLSALHAAGVTFPSEVQLAILKAKLKTDGELRPGCTSEDAEHLLMALTPWHQKAHPELFHPLQPRMCDVICGWDVKLEAFTQLLLNYMVTSGLKRGVEGSAGILTAIRAALTFYRDLASIPDECVDVVSELLKIFRGLTYMLDAAAFNCLSDGVHLCASESTAALGAESSRCVVLAIIKSIPFYKVIAQDVRKTAAATKENLQHYTVMYNQLCKAASGIKEDELLDMLQGYFKYSRDIRALLQQRMAKVLVPALNFAHDAIQQISKNLDPSAGQENMAKADSYLAIFTLAESHLAVDGLQVSLMVSDVHAVKHKMLGFLQASAFKDSVSKVNDEWLSRADEQNIKQLCLGQHIKAALQQEQATVDVSAALDAVVRVCEKDPMLGTSLCTSILTNARSWKDSVCSCAPGQQEQVDVLLATIPLKSQYDAMQELGNTEHETFKNDTGLQNSKKLMALVKQVESLMAGKYLNLVTTVFYLKVSRDLLSSIAGLSIKQHVSDLTYTVEQLTLLCGPVVPEATNWKKKLGDDCAWNDVFAAAKKTILTLDGDIIESQTNELDSAFQAFKKDFEMFEVEPSELAALQHELLGFHTLVCESHLIAGCAKFEGDTSKLRKWALKAQTQQNNWGVKLHPIMLSKMDDMINLRSS